MRERSLRIGEWLLMLIDASDALIGDLHESALRRSVRWYWSEWCRVVLMTVTSAARRHPLRAGWIGSMTLVAILGGFQVALGLAQCAGHKVATISHSKCIARAGTC